MHYTPDLRTIRSHTQWGFARLNPLFSCFGWSFSDKKEVMLVARSQGLSGALRTQDTPVVTLSSPGTATGSAHVEDIRRALGESSVGVNGMALPSPRVRPRGMERCVRAPYCGRRGHWSIDCSRFPRKMSRVNATCGSWRLARVQRRRAPSASAAVMVATRQALAACSHSPNGGGEARNAGRQRAARPMG